MFFLGQYVLASLMAPSFAAGDNGRELGTLFYAYAPRWLTVFPLSDATTVTITHDMTSAFHIGDRVGMLHQGHIIALESPQDFKQLEDPRVRQFLRREAEGPLSQGM